MRLVVAAIGRLKQGPERELAALYRKRAEATGRSLGLRDVEVIEIRESRAQDAERRRVEESIALANVIPDGAIVVVLDQRGQSLDSAVLAALLREWRAEDRAAVCFIIGGADGLAPSLAARAKLRLAFGAATGRISSCASCCWNSSIAPAPFSPGILITGADRALNCS